MGTKCILSQEMKMKLKKDDRVAEHDVPLETVRSRNGVSGQCAGVWHTLTAILQVLRMLQALSILKVPGAASRRCTESLVFYLHYRVTFLMLMFACIIISTREFVGDKIQCVTSSNNDVGVALLNSYCWAASTYSVSSTYFKEVGIDVPHPGVDASENESEYTYRNYYQYVHMVLFLQALLFYLPHFIWKGIDQEYIKIFYDLINPCKPEETSNPSTPCNSSSCKLENIKEDKPNIVNFKPASYNPEKVNEEKLHNTAYEAASNYIEDRWSTHKEYALKYIFCEILSLINLLVQSYLLDVFLHGQFLGLGYYFTPHYNAERMKDPIRIFPLVTSCYFKKFGASGFVDTVGAICVLPINALNVKIYLFIWIWFAVLLGLSFCSLLNLCLAWFLPRYRTLFLRWRLSLFKTRVSQVSYMKAVTSGDFGDWFVLSCIKSNVDPLEFSRLMEILWSKLSTFGIETKEP